jgi:hypothetical protein
VAVLRAAVRRTLAAPSFTVVIHRSASGRSHELVEAGIYELASPARAELVERARQAASRPGVKVLFSVGRTLYALYDAPAIMRREPGSGITAVVDPVRALVRTPLTIRGWSASGPGRFRSVQRTSGSVTTWTAVIRDGRLFTLAETARSRGSSVTTTTTVLGLGVSVVPTPDRRAVDEAEDLMASE